MRSHTSLVCWWQCLPHTADHQISAWAGLYPCDFPDCFYCEYDPTLCGKHDLPYFKSFRKNKSYSPQVRPQYDLCTDCRKLHTNLPDRFERSGRIFPVRSCLGNRTDRHYRKNLLVTCPKWFSSVLYISMGWVCVLAFTQIVNSLSPAAFGWAPGRRYHLHCRRHHLCFESSAVRAKHKNFGSHEIFHLFVMAGSACHFILMYVYIA